MIYQVEIKEILSKIIEVEADDAIDARLLAEEMYRGEEIVKEFCSRACRKANDED